MNYLKKEIFSDLTNNAVEIALNAGAVLKKGFSTSYKISKKEGIHNLVTEYDLLSEKAIIAAIKEKYPHHVILCEESGLIKENSEYKWIVDPLDGTVNFAHRIPFFSVSIGVQKNEETLSGVVYNPMTEELFIAEKNKGAYLNGKKIYVSKNQRLEDSLVATGFPYNLLENPNHCIESFLNIARKGTPLRRLGSAAIDLAYVACGRFDAFWETDLCPWDVAAGNLLIEEAGGLVTHWDNSLFKMQMKNAILASNKLIHEILTNLLTKI